MFSTLSLDTSQYKRNSALWPLQNFKAQYAQLFRETLRHNRHRPSPVASNVVIIFHEEVIIACQTDGFRVPSKSSPLECWSITYSPVSAHYSLLKKFGNSQLSFFDHYTRLSCESTHRMDEAPLGPSSLVCLREKLRSHIIYRRYKRYWKGILL